MSEIRKKGKKSAFSSNINEKTLLDSLDFTSSEQYRMLRNNILFTLPGDVKCPVIGVSSSIAREGKSTVAINLSYFLAKEGKRVLLIEGDLRIPSIAKKLSIKNKPGLTDILLDSDIDIDGFKSTLNENWYVVPSGELPPNPSELIGSQRMGKLIEMFKEKFDFIVIDLPPVNLVSDVMSASTFITGMIVVIREDYVTKKDLEQCMSRLKLSNVNILGCVIRESEKRKNEKKYSKYGNYYKSYK